MHGERKYIKLGEFEVGDLMFASDPCYNRVEQTDFSSAVIPVFPGTWETEIVTSDEGSWGNRVAELRAWHKEECHADFGYMNPLNWEYFSACGVDSGQLGFFDYKKYPIGVNGYETDYDNPDNWYAKACKETHNEKNPSKKAGLVEEMGVNSSAGFGDGVYEVFVARNTDDEIVAVKAMFIPEDGDDHD